ncbi:MAG: hypothetical protein LC737_07225 [Chloroflexi bacterium]|nr:hypothetical protein [Chloroflexota bacterium]
MTTPLLVRLQQLDGDADRARQRIAELNALLADRRQLLEAEDASRAAHASAEQQRAILRSRELELKSLDGRIAELDQKLYSGRIRNPKELESFERESRMFKGNRSKLEETVLELMEAADAAAREEQSHAKMLDALRAECAAAEQSWQRELQTLEAQLADTHAQTQSVRGEIGIEDLDVYDRVRKRAALAVVTLRSGRCGACNIGVSTDVLERAADEYTIAQCDNCRRILYVE